MKSLIRLLILTVIISTFISCEDKDDPVAEQLKKDMETIETYLSDNGISNNKIIDGIYEVNINEGNGPTAEADKILEVGFSLRKFDTNETFYQDNSYIYIPNNGFYIEDVTGNFEGMNISVLEMSVGDLTEFYLASRYAFLNSSGNLNGVLINANQIVIAEIELIAVRTAEEQVAYENDLIKNTISQLAMEADSLESGVYRIILEEGAGDDVTTLSSAINVDYEGSFIDGEVFDSNDNANLNLVDVIEGWQIGMVGLKKDAQVIILIPSGVAYGPTGFINNQGEVQIPSFSTLVFEVTVNDF